MTVIAGAISRRAGKLPEGLQATLVANLSRHPGDVVETFGDGSWFLAKIDVGALKCKGSFSMPGGAAFVLAGEPLMSGVVYGGSANREAEGRLLFEDLVSDGHAALKACTGTFCGAYYVAQEHRLVLITDKLGLRPIYYLITPEFAVFSSALRVFEAAGLNFKGIDERGTYEMCAFGFPLGNRTCYDGVRIIGPAELVHITRHAEQHLSYFKWDQLPDVDCDETSLIEKLSLAFAVAVKSRLRGDRTTLSFLSGGLDSRAIVAMLRKENVNVFTVNFAPLGTQDFHFATLAAQALGANHHHLDVPPSAAADFYRLAQVKEWIDSLAISLPKPERPYCIWGGDGGSVGMGHVYMDVGTVDAFERGDLEAGVRGFLSYNRRPGASNRAMTRAFRERSRSWHIDGVREEIASLGRKLDGRTLHLFLMLNDQRRHMAKHFEDIDVNRFEFLMPFFDSNFLEVIICSPVTPFLRHALYHKWLEAFSPAAVSVPWQTYPDHVPCTVTCDEQLRYQWGEYYVQAEERRMTRKQGREAFSRLIKQSFPGHLIGRVNYASAIAMSVLGSSALSHIVRVGDTFVRYWQQCHPKKRGGSAPVL